MRTVIPAASLLVFLVASVSASAQQALDELERLLEELPAAPSPLDATPPTAREMPRAERAPAYLGVTIEDRRIDRSPLILSVNPDGPAAQAGIQADDVIVALDRNDTLTLDAFSSTISSFSAGDRVAVEVMRGGRRFEFQVTMGARGDRIAATMDGRITSDYPPPPSREVESVNLGRPILGIQIGPLNGPNYRLLGLSTERGVIVEDVIPNSPAHQHGVPRGAILIGINGLRVEGVYDVMAMMARLPPDRPVELTYIVGGRAYRNTIPLEPIARADVDEVAPLDLPPAPEVEDVVPVTPPPPAVESAKPIPERPTPAEPEAELRLPSTATDEATDDEKRVQAMQDELKELRDRAAALESALDKLRNADKEE